MLCARKGQAGALVCETKLCEGKLTNRKGTDPRSASQQGLERHQCCYCPVPEELEPLCLSGTGIKRKCTSLLFGTRKQLLGNGYFAPFYVYNLNISKGQTDLEQFYWEEAQRRIGQSQVSSFFWADQRGSLNSCLKAKCGSLKGSWDFLPRVWWPTVVPFVWACLQLQLDQVTWSWQGRVLDYRTGLQCDQLTTVAAGQQESATVLPLPLSGASGFVHQDLQKPKDELTRVTRMTSHVDELTTDEHRSSPSEDVEGIGVEGVRGVDPHYIPICLNLGLGGF